MSISGQKKKILFVWDMNDYARSRQRFRAFQRLGHDVRGISSEPIGRVAGVSGKLSLYERIC